MAPRSTSDGIPIGYLDRVELSNSSDPKRAVVGYLKVRSTYLKDIPSDSVVASVATNVLGGKILNIVRGTSSQPVKDGGELASSNTQDINQIMAQMGVVFQSFQGIVTRVDNMLAGVEQGKGNLGLLIKDDELYRRLNAIAADGQQVLNDVRKGNGTISKLIYERFGGFALQPDPKAGQADRRPPGAHPKRPGHRQPADQRSQALRRSAADRARYR